MSPPIQAPRQHTAAEQLVAKAHNRTPAGLPLDEWNKIQNAKKRARRARKGKR